MINKLNDERMKSRILPIIVLLFLSIAAYSQQVYKNNDYNFQVNFPDGWELKKGDESRIIVRAVYDEFTEINIVQESQEGVNDSTFASMGIDLFYKGMEKRLKNMLLDYKTIEYAAVKISGINSYYINYSCSNFKRQMNACQYFFVRKGVLYVITAGCSDDEYEKYKTMFKDCVNSFEFMK